MTQIRPIALCAVLIGTFATACGGGPGKVQAAAPAVAATPVDAAPAAVASQATAGGTVTGTVAETMKGGGYTYVRLQTGKEDVWIAASEFDTREGDRLTAALDMPMQNFHSKTFNRDFALIYFVSQISRDGKPVGTAADTAAGTAADAADAPAAQRAPAMSSHDSAAAAAPQKIAPPPGGMSI